ncbi:uncharacterized protein [Linepithema humile]|uniref:uncharacterized protein n=1 Tax=Linepithema humile TaxID=83485 RepID=UPI0006237103|nr:PREDICTED: uncharacterized protein LOC105675037 [Linepithema humile]
MDKKHSTNYDDRIKFVIALMKKDYTTAYDIGNQLLKHNQNDVDLIKGLKILKQLNQREIEKCKRSCSIGSPIESDNEGEDSVAADGDDFDFIADSKDIRIDPGVRNKTAPSETPQSNNNEKPNIIFKDKMHRAILIKLDKNKSKTAA